MGKASIRGIVQRQDLELVGLIVHDSEKVGKDAGVIAGIEETGILATDQIDEVLSKDIDCVHYTPLLLLEWVWIRSRQEKYFINTPTRNKCCNDRRISLS